MPMLRGFLCLPISELRRFERHAHGAAARRFSSGNALAPQACRHEKNLCTGGGFCRVDGSHVAQNARIGAIRFADSALAGVACGGCAGANASLDRRLFLSK